MTSRRPTPNLLDPMSDVMGGRKEQNPKAIKPETNKPEDIPPHDLPAETFDGGVKEKATFNLSKDLLIELEEAWMNLRRSFRGQRVTKTMLVEEAIEHAVEDLLKNKENSLLYRKLANHKTT